MNHLKNIRSIIKFSPRQGSGQTRAAEWVKKQLHDLNIPFRLQKFHIDIPEWTDWGLKVDGKSVDCLPSGLSSGKISGKMNIRNSLLEEEFSTAAANINFNPFCPVASRPSLYAQPALSVSPNVLAQVLRGTSIQGFMKVRRKSHQAANILVGNKKNPRTISFAHMDSVETGAIDNASGVSVLLGVLAGHPELLNHHLFVFSASEEMSFDLPTYWGYDFRVFEKRLATVLAATKAIFAVDGLGFGPTECVSGAKSEEVYLAFPIKGFQKWKHKIFCLSASYHDLLPVYHSVIDDGRMLQEKWMQQAEQFVWKKIRSVQ